VCAVNNVVYELFNRKLYEGAFGLAVIVCQELCKDCPPSLPLDRVRTKASFGHFKKRFLLRLQKNKKEQHKKLWPLKYLVFVLSDLCVIIYNSFKLYIQFKACKCITDNIRSWL